MSEAPITDYIPVLVQVVVAIVFSVVSIISGILMGRKGIGNADKDKAYECGKDPLESSQPRFSVKFYLVAMLFILFDIEVVFMYPWAIVFREMVAHGTGILWSMISFVLILGVGYLYALKKGALDWTRNTL